MVFAYVRVSSKSQSYARQLKALESVPGLQRDRIFCEKKSGSTTEGREELKKLLNTVREGDTIYVHSIDRLGRSLMDVLQIIRFLDGLKVRLVSVSQGIDSGTPTGKIFIMVCGLMAEMELMFIRERSSEGMKIAKDRKRLGRPRKALTSAEKALYDDYIEHRKTASECMELLHTSHSTFFRRVKEYKDQRAVQNERRTKEIFETLAEGRTEVQPDRGYDDEIIDY